MRISQLDIEGSNPAGMQNPTTFLGAQPTAVNTNSSSHLATWPSTAVHSESNSLDLGSSTLFLPSFPPLK
jgi:hypothetical protein